MATKEIMNENVQWYKRQAKQEGDPEVVKMLKFMVVQTQRKIDNCDNEVKK